jgi:uroporphyrin-3 C-methyltransferase
MNSAVEEAPASDTAAHAQTDAKPQIPWWLYLAALVAIAALLASVLLWQKVQGMQENLARQSAEAVSQSTDAKGTSHHAQELAMETAAKLAVTDAKLAEVALQRAQVEELIQSLSRSRDENLVVDIDAAIRLAQQQAQLTGSIEPLVSALKMADVRLGRAAQPRLAPLQRAIARDIARVQNTPLSDTPALLVQFDELVLLADELPKHWPVSRRKRWAIGGCACWRYCAMKSKAWFASAKSPNQRPPCCLLNNPFLYAKTSSCAFLMRVWV